MALMATPRPVSSSRAWKTVPVPPIPSTPSTANRPRISPAGKSAGALRARALTPLPARSAAGSVRYRVVQSSDFAGAHPATVVASPAGFLARRAAAKAARAGVFGAPMTLSFFEELDFDGEPETQPQEQPRRRP